jgi:hypothetical protein
MRHALKSRLPLLTVLLCVLLFGGGLGATWYYHPRVVFGVGDIPYADSTSTLNSLPIGTAGQMLNVNGGATAPAWTSTLPATLASAEKTDVSIFVPAYKSCRSDAVTMLIVRLAANDWALARTAAGAETFNFICSLDLDLQRTTALKGVKITSIALVYQITVAALTSQTWGKVTTVTYANAAANVIGADLSTPPTLATLVQATPYVTQVAVAVPAYLPGATQITLNVEWQAVMQNTGIYRLYGVQINGNRTDL